MKIVSYNIHKGMDANEKFTLNKITKYLKNLNCDVICLQEVLYHQFAKLKLDLKMDGVFATNVNKPYMMYGICTLTKANVNFNEHIFLSSKKEQRGFLNVNINEEFGMFNIINTHLGLDKYERYDQINEILNYTMNLKGNIVLCGDFNEKNINIDQFTDIAVYFKKYNLPTFEKSRARIDYIYIDKCITPKNYTVDNVNMSDHYPIIGYI